VKSGHGSIRYCVENYNSNEIIQLCFSKPKIFNGVRKIEIKELTDKQTEVKHVVVTNTKSKGVLYWSFAIRALHNVLIEDSSDLLENNFLEKQISSKWSN
jgi:hypothetical protein